MMKPNMPGMEAMTDTLEFVKNMWGNMGIPGMQSMGSGATGMPGMNIPGMVMPTLSVEEINKKITDLKTVESWLNLNMSMLRSTIQALEVQSATLGTLQSMGETFAATMNAGFSGMSGDGAVSGNGGSAPDGATASPDFGATDSDKLEGAPEPGGKDSSDAAALTAPLLNAAAWWNMLQGQFTQAVSNAMAEPEPEPAPAPAAPKAAAKPRAKPKAEPAPRTRRKTK